MINLATTINTSTGIRAVQVKGNGFKWRLDTIRLHSIIKRDLNHAELQAFNKNKSGIIESVLFDNKEQCADDLCKFILMTTGLHCTY